MNDVSAQTAQVSSRIGYLIPAILILGLAGSVTWLSYTQEPAAAFLFPRLISTVMIVLAFWNFVRAATGVSKVGKGMSVSTWMAILPGIILMSVFVFFAARYFGFYAASTLVFFLMYSGYDPASHRSLPVWLKRVGITVLFMAIIYLLFTLILKVQTPRGLFL